MLSRSNDTPKQTVIYIHYIRTNNLNYSENFKYKTENINKTSGIIIISNEIQLIETINIQIKEVVKEAVTPAVFVEKCFTDIKVIKKTTINKIIANKLPDSVLIPVVRSTKLFDELIKVVLYIINPFLLL